MVWEAIIHMKDVLIAGNSIHINYYIFVFSFLKTFSIPNRKYKFIRNAISLDVYNVHHMAVDNLLS